MDAARVGKRGTFVVPAKLRKRYGIKEGTLVTSEEHEDGILIRPAMVVPVDSCSSSRKAEFLLSNATTKRDYLRARNKLGLDPDAVLHRRPRSMDRLFLDANILFSATYRPSSGLLRLCRLKKVVLCSWRHAIGEARINLTEESQKPRLTKLLRSLQLFDATNRTLPRAIFLPDKD
jgi:AbrB family looped-hinge helix DNA binding protein